MKNNGEGIPPDPLKDVYGRVLKNVEGGVNIFNGVEVKGPSVYHHILNNAMNNMNILPFMRAARASKEELAEAEATMMRNLELIKKLEELPEEVKEELRLETDVHKIAKKYCGSPEITNVEGLVSGLQAYQAEK